MVNMFTLQFSIPNAKFSNFRLNAVVNGNFVESQSKRVDFTAYEPSAVRKVIEFLRIDRGKLIEKNYF